MRLVTRLIGGGALLLGFWLLEEGLVTRQYEMLPAGANLFIVGAILGVVSSKLREFADEHGGGDLGPSGATTRDSA